eukprot:15493738-Heterocapsa_arctica.AAC.1
MRKCNILVRKGKEHSRRHAAQKSRKQFLPGGHHKAGGVDGSWGIKGAGPLIVIPGGNAQIADRLQEAEKAWGGLWAVKAEGSPEFDKQPMDLIIEEGIIR